MNKIMQSIWMRILAGILCIVSGLTLLVTAFGMIIWTSYDKEEWLDRGYAQIANNYTMYAVSELEPEEMQEFFESLNMYVKIQKCYPADSQEGTREIVINNMPFEEVEAGYSFSFTDEDRLLYSKDSLFEALYSYADSDEAGFDEASYDIQNYLFDPSEGRFYCQAFHRYYFMDHIHVNKTGYEVKCYEWKDEAYIDKNGNKLDTTTYADWEYIEFDGNSRPYYTADTESGKMLEIVTDNSELKSLLKGGYLYIHDVAIYEDLYNRTVYNVKFEMKDELLTGDLFYECYELVNRVERAYNNSVWILLLAAVIFILSLVLMVISCKKNKESLRFYHKIPIGIFSFLALITELGMVFCIELILQAANRADYGTQLQSLLSTVALLAVIMCGVAYTYLVNVITRIRCRSFWRYSEVYYVWHWFKLAWNYFKTQILCRIRKAVRTVGENIPLFAGGAGILLLVSFVELVVLMNLAYNPGEAFSLFFVYKCVEIPFLLYLLWQMKVLYDGTSRIASGKIEPIVEKGMIWYFRKHAKQINNVGNGISVAVEERMKSERFKTELITNVSHDIKTPLTSIINYVDLLQKQEIEDPVLVEYVEVLDRQSARLKKLIEDLMEASKASTGNLSVNLEACDLKVLLEQMVGEFEEKFAKTGLVPVLTLPEQDVEIMADGRHIWRVLDNLLNNICKYSQDKTRVYISLERKDETAKIVFRNISKEALNMSSEQLMQRFVRGDSSRHTEGSGLGLSIAQSLTELMNGQLSLEIDGDLFKSILEFPIINK